MVLMELALYGIRNFVQLTRFSFKPGLNLIIGGNGSGKSTLHDSLLAIFSPISRTSLQHLRTRQSTSVCQVALTFKDNDDRVYRLIRDFGNQKSTLAQLDPSNNFQIKEQQEEPITQFLSDQTAGLPQSVVLGLFSIKTAWMPSSRPQPASLSPSGPESSLMNTTPSPEDAPNKVSTREEKEARLVELRGLIAQADKLAGMEDQLSDVQSGSAEISRRLRLIHEKSKGLAQLTRQGEHLESIGKLPEDYHLILATAEQQEQLKTENLGAIDDEMESLKRELDAIPNEPFYLNRFFLAGVGLSIIAMILVAVLDLPGLFQNLLMVGLIAGLGLMGYGASIDFSRVSRRQKLGAKIRENERQRTRTESTFRKENSQYTELLKKTGCTDAAGLQEKISEYERFLTARRDLEMERDQNLSGKTTEELQAELDSLKKKISEIEAGLKSATLLSSDLYMIQEEARILERDLMAPQPGNPDSLRNIAAPPPGSATRDPSPASKSSESELLSPQLLSAIRDPEIQKNLLVHLSELKVQLNGLAQRMEVADEADIGLASDMVPVLTSKKSSTISWGHLSSGQRDCYHLIYHLAVIRSAVDRYPIPLLLDNPLSILDANRQKTVLDLLAEIARNRQTLLFSSALYSDREDHHLIRLQ